MYADIKDVKIVTVNDGLSLSFSATSKIEPDNKLLMTKIFDDMTDKAVTNRGSWQELDDELLCRLLADQTRIEIKDVANQSSALVLVPAILLDKEIISEQQKDLLFRLIDENPLVQQKNHQQDKEADLTFLKKARDRIFGKNP